MFGKRDLVIQRNWRVEEDGTHVVTLNSVEHPLCPPPKPKSGFSWFTSPVRAQVRKCFPLLLGMEGKGGEGEVPWP